MLLKTNLMIHHMEPNNLFWSTSFLQNLSSFHKQIKIIATAIAARTVSQQLNLKFLHNNFPAFLAFNPTMEIREGKAKFSTRKPGANLIA